MEDVYVAIVDKPVPMNLREKLNRLVGSGIMHEMEHSGSDKSKVIKVFLLYRKIRSTIIQIN